MSVPFDNTSVFLFDEFLFDNMSVLLNFLQVTRGTSGVFETTGNHGYQKSPKVTTLSEVELEKDMEEIQARKQPRKQECQVNVNGVGVEP